MAVSSFGGGAGNGGVCAWGRGRDCPAFPPDSYLRRGLSGVIL